jgi:hypothetical protein
METDVMKPLSREIAEQVPWLHGQFGFTIVDEGYDSKAFGNSWVTLQGPIFFATFVRDCGEIWVDLSPRVAPAFGVPLDDIFQGFMGKPASPVYRSVRPLAESLRAEMAGLEQLLGFRWAETKVRLLQFDQARKDEFFDRMRAAGNIVENKSRNT